MPPYDFTPRGEYLYHPDTAPHTSQGTFEVEKTQQNDVVSWRHCLVKLPFSYSLSRTFMIIGKGVNPPRYWILGMRWYLGEEEGSLADDK